MIEKVLEFLGGNFLQYAAPLSTTLTENGADRPAVVRAV
jgi:hypothetical protein